METNPELLGPTVVDYPERFAAMVTEAVAADTPARSGDVARTLLSTVRGVKHDAETREEFLERVTVAVDLLLTALRH
jgi:hypothetical protein